VVDGGELFGGDAIGGVGFSLFFETADEFIDPAGVEEVIEKGCQHGGAVGLIVEEGEQLGFSGHALAASLHDAGAKYAGADVGWIC